MINKIQKIREEVEKQLNLLERFAEKLKNGLRMKHKKKNGMTDKEKIITDLKQALDELDITSNLRLVLINTIEYLQKKSISEDFEEALASEWKAYNDRGAATVDAFEDNTQELAFAKGFYRGSNWKKEQMMKDAIDREVAEGSMCPSIERLPVLTHTNMILLPKDKFKSGDKVKLIIIKEE